MNKRDLLKLLFFPIVLIIVVCLLMRISSFNHGGGYGNNYYNKSVRLGTKADALTEDLPNGVVGRCQHNGQ